MLRVMASARRITQRPLTVVAVVLFAWVAAPAPASALVTLRPGESALVPVGTTTPALPPKLDFALLMDTTGSMTGERANVQAGAGGAFDSIRADSPDSMFAVAGFDDFPYSTYGLSSAGDLPYYLNSDLTVSKTQWQSAINALPSHSGSDAPEAQVAALYKAATGAALTWPGGSVAAGNGISFRGGAAHVIALVSDAAFHNDKAGNDVYSFTAPTYAEALSALGDNGVRVIAADSSSIAATEPDMAAIAADTAGAHVGVNPDGTGLTTAVLAALNGLTYDVTATMACDPLEVSLDPGSFPAVARETPLSQDATITVPADVDPAALPNESPLHCVVSYSWGAVAIGTAEHQVQVVLPSSTEVTGAARHHRIKARGSVAPGHPGDDVALTLLRKKAGGFAKIDSKRVALDDSSAFATAFKRPMTGRKCKLTASFAGDAGHDRSSASDKLGC